ncbi:MAG: LysM peptidoglycan-binding domain-containing protein [Anaerolineae bacterium]
MQPGDTLSKIAAESGTTVATLAALNQLADPNFIFVGQELLLPGEDQPVTASDNRSQCLPTVHAVVAGETLSGLAARYGVSVAEIAAANQIANPSLIRTGQTLRIPGEFCQEPLVLNEPFAEITWQPEIPKQGDTIRLTVVLSQAVSNLTGYFDEMPFRFVVDGNTYVAYLGVPAIAEPGFRQVQLLVDGEPQQIVAIPVLADDFPVERLVLTPETTKLLDPEIVQRENDKLGAVTEPFTAEILWRGPFRLPLDGNPPVISRFGTRRAYNDGPVASYHGGTDFSGIAGTPVHASARGRVVLAEALNVRGNAVILDHGAGIYTMYCHLDSIIAKVGDVLEAGESVGLLGNTGLSTGAHLHWEMRVQGERVDPMRWLSNR